MLPLLALLHNCLWEDGKDMLKDVDMKKATKKNSKDSTKHWTTMAYLLASLSDIAIPGNELYHQKIKTTLDSQGTKTMCGKHNT